VALADSCQRSVVFNELLMYATYQRNKCSTASLQKVINEFSVTSEISETKNQLARGVQPHSNIQRRPTVVTLTYLQRGEACMVYLRVIMFSDGCHCGFLTMKFFKLHPLICAMIALCK